MEMGEPKLVEKITSADAFSVSTTCKRRVATFGEWSDPQVGAKYMVTWAPNSMVQKAITSFE